MEPVLLLFRESLNYLVELDRNRYLESLENNVLGTEMEEYFRDFYCEKFRTVIRNCTTLSSQFDLILRRYQHLTSRIIFFNSVVHDFRNSNHLDFSINLGYIIPIFDVSNQFINFLFIRISKIIWNCLFTYLLFFKSSLTSSELMILKPRIA